MDAKERVINAAAGKFLADNKRRTPVTDETIKNTLKFAVLPPKEHLYGAIKERVEEMRNDSKYKFSDE